MTALKKHQNTTYHREKVSTLHDPSLTSMLIDEATEGRVRNAEIHMAAFITEHNLYQFVN